MQVCTQFICRSLILLVIMFSSQQTIATDTSRSKTADDVIIFQPLYRKCLSLKNELTHPNLEMTYSKRPKHYSPPDAWVLRWQKIYIPIPRKKYKTLLIFDYQKTVKKYASSPGFILIAKDGTAVVAMHYFKTLKFVYTNGIDFITNLPIHFKKNPIIMDLYHPEISTTQQSKMFSYRPKDLNCYRLGKVKRTIITALLLVKLNYSLGTLISVYKSTGGYSGWVSKEKTSIRKTHSQASWIVWKAFYTRLFSRSVVNHVRIYSPHNRDITNLEYSFGYKYRMGYEDRPDWLYRLENILYRRSTTNRIELLRALKEEKFDQRSLSNASTIIL